ncbi:MAG: bifunctional tetrahydrofolate synthase/dihydrofolate synthase [Sedimenticola sp.]
MRFDTLQAWLDWQSQLHPSEIELGLERVGSVWSRLHPDPLPCKVITVAGTNGKGSSVAFLEAIFRAGGYRVGCYTSPHMLRYNERIRLDGIEVTDEQLCRAFEQVDQLRGDTPLTYFEFGALAALVIFSSEPLDVVVLEVGLGGRLDAVNIIDADVALITTVDIDHSDWLGDTREKIGREKAGIMRPGHPVVFAGSNPPESVIHEAERLRSPLFRSGDDFTFHTDQQGWSWRGKRQRRHALPYPHLRGSHQLANAAAVLMVLECLEQALPLDQQAIRAGLQEARLPGRFQVVGGTPVTILDVAHNPEAVKTLQKNLNEMGCSGRTLAVFSMLEDKDIDEVVRIIAPTIDHWYLAPLTVPRAATIEQLTLALTASGVGEQQFDCRLSVASALQTAKEEGNDDDRIVVFGSFFTVSALLDLV